MRDCATPALEMFLGEAETMVAAAIPVAAGLTATELLAAQKAFDKFFFWFIVEYMPSVAQILTWVASLGDLRFTQMLTNRIHYAGMSINQAGPSTEGNSKQPITLVNRGIHLLRPGSVLPTENALVDRSLPPYASDSLESVSATLTKVAYEITEELARRDKIIPTNKKVNNKKGKNKRTSTPPPQTDSDSNSDQSKRPPTPSKLKKHKARDEAGKGKQEAGTETESSGSSGYDEEVPTFDEEDTNAPLEKKQPRKGSRAGREALQRLTSGTQRLAGDYPNIID